MTNLSIRIHSFVVSALSSFRESLREERGQDLIEYALIGGLIAAALVAAFFILNPYILNMAHGIGNCVDFDSTSKCTAGP